MAVKYYGDTVSGLTERENKHYALAREAASEGIVLLKNNGVLPLKENKVALYGMGAVKTVAGGTGSGSVNQRYTVNIRTGFENAGITVTTAKYLDDCQKEFDDSFKAWHDLMEEKTSCLANPYMLFATIGQFEFKYPYGRAICDEDLSSETDTAVYVIMRQAGEGNDRKLEKGDFLITDLERENIEKIAGFYKHVIIVVNVGGMIDLSFTDEIKNIDGIIYFAQAGMEGANALGELVSGKANFSGKLADTWAKTYDDVPFGREYSYLNGNLKNEYYKEGVFVGYRYFDTFGVEPRFPFGFGLSYTDFEIKVEKVSLKGTEVNVKLSVRNNGGCSGKEVVQAYVSHLNGSADEVKKQLVAFTKTDKISADKSFNTNLTFDLRDCAVYDLNSAEWILRSGKYALYVGNSSKNIFCVATFAVGRDTVTEKCKSLCGSEKRICELNAPVRNDTVTSDVPRFEVDTQAIKAVTHTYSDDFEESEEERKVLDGLTVEEMIQLVRGADLQTTPEGSNVLRGNGGKTATTLLSKGINNITLVDGPAGLNIFNHVYRFKDFECTVTLPERMNWSVLKKNIPPLPEGGIHIYRYATAWPTELVLAQTWNTDLLYQIGCAVGREMTEFGVDVWLAPGMNIHRNPLCGRNFEYYSEDPYITGKMAAALVKGVQTYENKGVAIKHFCCNNQEDNRFKVSSEIDENALRQIYLKGFEIAVKESQPKTIMSSYNKLNGTYTSNSKQLITEILRCEWGFKGVVMTDWGTCDNGQSDAAKCIAAGNDLIMPGSNRDSEVISAAIAESSLDKKDLRKCAARVLRLIRTIL